MKLPENYKSWIEFAKECNDLQCKYPKAHTIKVNNSEVNGSVSEHVINDVKAKAFDELTEDVKFKHKDVDQLKYELYHTGINSNTAIDSIINLLYKLANG